jgi:hypothetical protein
VYGLGVRVWGFGGEHLWFRVYGLGVYKLKWGVELKIGGLEFRA